MVREVRDQNSLVCVLRKLASQSCAGRASLLQEISARRLPSEAVDNDINQDVRETGRRPVFLIKVGRGASTIQSATAAAIFACRLIRPR